VGSGPFSVVNFGVVGVLYIHVGDFGGLLKKPA